MHALINQILRYIILTAKSSGTDSGTVDITFILSYFTVVNLIYMIVFVACNFDIHTKPAKCFYLKLIVHRMVIYTGLRS